MVVTMTAKMVKYVFRKNPLPWLLTSMVDSMLWRLTSWTKSLMKGVVTAGLMTEQRPGSSN
jgi:hypothetical protein